MNGDTTTPTYRELQAELLTSVFGEDVGRQVASGWSGILHDPDTGEELYITGTAQPLGNIHHRDLCQGRHCPIHNPSFHSMFSFPTHWRGDRKIMERICPHGVGHPDPDDVAYLNLRYPKDASVHGIHGCDGCCREDR